MKTRYEAGELARVPKADSTAAIGDEGFGIGNPTKDSRLPLSPIRATQNEKCSLRSSRRRRGSRPWTRRIEVMLSFNPRALKSRSAPDTTDAPTGVVGVFADFPALASRHAQAADPVVESDRAQVWHIVAEGHRGAFEIHVIGDRDARRVTLVAVVAATPSAAILHPAQRCDAVVETARSQVGFGARDDDAAAAIVGVLADFPGLARSHLQAADSVIQLNVAQVRDIAAEGDRRPFEVHVVGNRDAALPRLRDRDANADGRTRRQRERSRGCMRKVRDICGFLPRRISRISAVRHGFVRGHHRRHRVHRAKRFCFLGELGDPGGDCCGTQLPPAFCGVPRRGMKARELLALQGWSV